MFKVNILSLMLIATLFGINSSAENARFDNYRLYDIYIDNDQQLVQLNELENSSNGFLFWKPAKGVGSLLKLVVPPHKFADFSDLVKLLELRVSMQSNNLQS